MLSSSCSSSCEAFFCDFVFLSFPRSRSLSFLLVIQGDITKTNAIILSDRSLEIKSKKKKLSIYFISRSSYFFSLLWRWKTVKNTCSLLLWRQTNPIDRRWYRARQDKTRETQCHCCWRKKKNSSTKKKHYQNQSHSTSWSALIKVFFR